MNGFTITYQVYDGFKKIHCCSNSRSPSFEYCPKVLIVPITPLIGYKLSQPFCGLTLKGTGALEISRLSVKIPETNEEFIIRSEIEPCNIIVLDLLTNKQGFHYWYSYPLKIYFSNS